MILKKKKLRNVARMITAGYLLSVFGLVVMAATDNTAVEVPTIEQRTESHAKIEKELISTPLQFTELNYVVSYDRNHCADTLNIVNESIHQLSNTLDNEESYTENAVHVMNNEYSRLLSVKKQLETDLEQFNKWEQEYYYATKTFEFLLSKGFSREVACGIIGNMMIETSGGSLALKPTIYNPSGNYYGLCQWSISYGLHGSSFEYQLEYLYYSLEQTFINHGYRYRQGFTYEDFLAITDPQETAQAFAKVYERCAASSYKIRQQSAQTAYEYFKY